MGKRAKKIASFALPIIGSFLGPAGFGISQGLGAALGGAAGGALKGGGLKGALIGGATGYAGNALGNSIAGALRGAGVQGSIGSSISPKNAIGPYSLGSSAVGARVANTGISDIVGGYAGNKLSGSVADSLIPEEIDTNIGGPKEPQPFNPTQQPQLSLPGSLTSFSSLDPSQQSTNIATQGVYGHGLGQEEQSYFQNLINRRLVDESGNVDQDLSEISPIEQSYLAQIGLGGYSNPRSLLEAMSRWRTA